LGEKQKLRYQYGLLERQFRRIFHRALRKRGVTGETLLQLLETRLDNVVYRLGFANTRSAARQLVSHGHGLENGRRVTVASHNVTASDARSGARPIFDNVVYRLGFANTRSAARQLVSHGHVLVNGRRVNVASYNVKAGDE